MKAVIRLELEAPSGEMAQLALLDACDTMKREGLATAYSFEIEAPEGTTTDRCVMSEGKIIA